MMTKIQEEMHVDLVKLVNSWTGGKRAKSADVLLVLEMTKHSLVQHELDTWEKLGPEHIDPT